MASHFDMFVRASVILALALLAMPLLRGRSASARRIVLSVAFAALVAVPFLPVWRVDAPHYGRLIGRVLAEPTTTGDASAPGDMHALLPLARTTSWLAVLWSIGALMVAARFVFGLAAARRLVGRARPAGSAWAAAIAEVERDTGARAVVLASPEVQAPAVTGLFAPVVLVPASADGWTDARKRSVLLHELAHVAAHDLAVQVLVSIACSIHWFNPLTWLAARRLRLERELAADEAVLRSGVRASSYASDLLAIAGAAPAFTLAIGEKPLARRITAIVAERRPAALGRARAAALILGSTALALGAACTATAESRSPSIVPAPPAVESGIQTIAEEELRRATTEWNASGGTVLVLSPKGEVLADAGGGADKAYVAGSTMKAFLLASAVDEGVVGEGDVFDCTRTMRGGHALQDSSQLGRAALPELLARSSNVGFAQVFDRLGAARFDRALRLFHFDTTPELAGAPAGDWNATLTAIGATMTTTPRQVALAYATLADGGRGVVKASTAARVSAMLEGVVASPNGTGKNARVPGVRVAGKTGSSEWTSPEGAPVTYASFVGWAPADHPRYVVFVGVQSPAGKEAWGGAVAAPVFARIVGRAMAR